MTPDEIRDFSKKFADEYIQDNDDGVLYLLGYVELDLIPEAEKLDATTLHNRLSEFISEGTDQEELTGGEDPSHYGFSQQTPSGAVVLVLIPSEFVTPQNWVKVTRRVRHYACSIEDVIEEAALIRDRLVEEVESFMPKDEHRE